MSNDDVREVLARNRILFDELVHRAEQSACRGDVDTAAARIQSAARHAWYNHPGIHRSAALESLIASLAAAIPAARVRQDVAGHTLHVATQVYGTGGHSRLIERWVTNDRSRPHSLVLTAQGGVALPDGLRSAIEASGGSVLHAGHGRRGLRRRASRLRGLAAAGPASILLHTHPHDVVPSLGLQRVDVPVGFVNHADHVFSLGLDVATAVADIRPAGRELSLDARGVPRHRSVLVPIPLSSPPALDRAAARARWGVDDESVVVASIATAYKFGARPGEHFIDVHRDFLRRHPRAVLLVVGPDSSGRWAQAAEEFAGRVRAVGVVSDVGSVYAAADIYADSLPFASLTSLLDAAARGVPVVAMAGNHRGTVLSSDDLALSGPVHFETASDYVAELDRLATDPVYRRERGEALRAAVADAHLQPTWAPRLEALAGVWELGGTLGALGQDRAELSDHDEALARFQLASGLSGARWRSEVEDAPFLALRPRLELFRRIPAEERRGAVKYLIPEPIRSAVSGLSHRLASRRRH